MAKLTKNQTKLHNQACDLLTKNVLTEDEKEFIFKNWNEGAYHINGMAGAFFTPFDMAFDFAIDAVGSGDYDGTVVDFCAGIGILSYACHWRSNKNVKLTCVEINPDYYEIGKKLLPEAEWINADIFDFMETGRHFDVAISNPPFGNVKRTKNSFRYTGREFEYHVIDIASQMADYGSFIVPQMSAGFDYSGKQCYKRHESGRAVNFQELTGMHFDTGVGIDTKYYQNDWKGVSPICEVVSVDFIEMRERKI